MKISEDFFIQILVEKLKKVLKHTRDIDERLYGQKDSFDDWNDARSASLILEDIIEGIENQ